MPTFNVELRREYTVTTYVDVEVVASSPAEAVELALRMADADQMPVLAFNDGEEGTTFAQTRRPDGSWCTGHNG